MRGRYYENFVSFVKGVAKNKIQKIKLKNIRASKIIRNLRGESCLREITIHGLNGKRDLSIINFIILNLLKIGHCLRL